MSSLRQRQTLAAAALILAALPSFVTAQEAAPAKPSPAATATYREMIWGDPKAKVTVIEYASLTCPHCAAFTNNVFPDVKKAYVDTGKIRFVFRDYPLDGLAMAGALLARCAPEDRGKKMIELMFKNLGEWAGAPQPIVPLKQYAALSGMSSADVEACLDNESLLKTLRDEQEKAATLYHVEATPTFYVNDEKVEGEHDFESFSKILDKHLGATSATKTGFVAWLKGLFQ